MPRVDELMGGRFWPAVVEYFRIRTKPDGKDESQWPGNIYSEARKRRGRRYAARSPP